MLKVSGNPHTFPDTDICIQVEEMDLLMTFKTVSAQGLHGFQVCSRGGRQGAAHPHKDASDPPHGALT